MIEVYPLTMEAHACARLYAGANHLLELEQVPLSRAERLVLLLVRGLARRRLDRVVERGQKMHAEKDKWARRMRVGLRKRPDLEDQAAVTEFSEALAEALNRAREEGKGIAEQALKEALLQAQVDASLQEHELGAWEPVAGSTSKWQALCHSCRLPVFVSSKAVYSLLAEHCPGQAAARTPR